MLRELDDGWTGPLATLSAFIHVLDRMTGSFNIPSSNIRREALITSNALANTLVVSVETAPVPDGTPAAAEIEMAGAADVILASVWGAHHNGGKLVTDASRFRSSGARGGEFRNLEM